MVEHQYLKKLSFLLITLLLIGCAPGISPEVDEELENMTVPAIVSVPRIRFLALGDSYTIGHNVSENDRWPEQLAVELREMDIEAEIEIVARTGWTTTNLLANLSANSPQGHFDIVSLLIGVNDQYQYGEPEEYRVKFREALEIAIRYAGGDPENVIVISIPDWEVTPYAEKSTRPFNEYSINKFNEVISQEARNYGARYVNITPISRLVVTDESLLAADGLHPSGEMYAMWVKEMLPQVLAVVEK